MMKFVTIFAVVLLGNASSAQVVDPNAKTSPDSGTRERPGHVPPPRAPQDYSPALMRQGGGSLLQAGRMTAGAPTGNSGGSLLAGGGTAPPYDPGKAAIGAYSPFAVAEPEPKLIKKHALVTIIIREESEATSQGSTDVKREGTVDAQVNQFVKLNLANLSLQPSVGGTTPSVNLTGNREFKGEGTVERQDSFITRITAEVVDVKPNGTLVLQARKRIKNDEEEQTFVASGICRVEDLTPDNTVLSTQLFDLEVSKQSKGQVRNSTKTGVIHKLLDFLNLF
ncbi:MAG TPA: flagellar basal body L-ring protein FlgH [Tepidisphaeraceae bacterium]|nr:flagellar basal body L-ring protein FlgH [Tepidisphaeraceae bacterium]